MLQLKRGSSKLAGDIGQLIAEIGKARQNILESQSAAQSASRKDDRGGGGRAQAVAAELADTEEKLMAVRDILRRSRIVSPVSGIVFKLNYHSAGAVIGCGQPIMDILPIDDKLVVEAMVNVQDIDNMRVGLPAELRFSTLNMRTTPIVQGQGVIHLGRQAAAERTSRGPTISPASRSTKGGTEGGDRRQLTPGLPAEVYIKTGERTLPASTC